MHKNKLKNQKPQHQGVKTNRHINSYAKTVMQLTESHINKINSD